MCSWSLQRTFLGGLKADEYQTDVAHMVYFSRHGLPLNSVRSDEHPANTEKDKVDPPDFCKLKEFSEKLECQADFYHGTIFDSPISIAEPPQHITEQMFDSGMKCMTALQSELSPDVCIESLTLCPKPNSLSTGSHRVVAIFWMSGERFAIAFEEGGSIFNPNRQNVFIDGLTPGADEMVRNLIFDQTVLIPAIVYAMTGYKLYAPAHTFSIKIYDPATPAKDPSHTGHWFEGCRPSKDMYHY